MSRSPETFETPRTAGRCDSGGGHLRPPPFILHKNRTPGLPFALGVLPKPDRAELGMVRARERAGKNLLLDFRFSEPFGRSWLAQRASLWLRRGKIFPSACSGSELFQSIFLFLRESFPCCCSFCFFISSPNSGGTPRHQMKGGPLKQETFENPLPFYGGIWYTELK